MKQIIKLYFYYIIHRYLYRYVMYKKSSDITKITASFDLSHLSHSKYKNTVFEVIINNFCVLKISGAHRFQTTVQIGQLVLAVKDNDNPSSKKEIRWRFPSVATSYGRTFTISDRAWSKNHMCFTDLF